VRRHKAREFIWIVGNADKIKEFDVKRIVVELLDSSNRNYN
jgi:hypothetical protein